MLAVLQALGAGREALEAAVAGIDDILANRRPEPEAWSILECVEHVVLAEQLLLSRLAAASQSEHSTGNRAREAAILARGADRTRPLKSPEEAVPSGRFTTLDNALAAFESARAATLRFVGGLEGDPRRRVTTHPLIPGLLNCYEMLLILAVHPLRHAEQIRAVRRSLAPLV